MIPLIIDIVGVAVGLFSIFILLQRMSKTGGVVRKTLVYFTFGVAFQTMALLESIIFGRLKFVVVPGGIDLHHLFMVIGLFIFVSVAFRLLSFLRGYG